MGATMKRSDIDSLADQFCTFMLSEQMAGRPRMYYDWAAEFDDMFPGLNGKARKAVINKVVKLIKSMGAADDASM
jgi:hypothetical protein